MQKLFLLIIPLVLLSGCIQDPHPAADKNKVSLRGAFILNEGNFGKSNSSLSFYDFEKNTVQNNIFKNINGRNLGDIAQSMTIIDTLGFILVGNSGKIEVISINTWKSVATINLLPGSSPRNLADGGNGKLYLTDLWRNVVTVLDKSTYKEETIIPVGSSPDEILVHKGKAYVANGGYGFSNTLSVIDLALDKVVKTVKVGDYPSYLSLDKRDRLHVLCQGRWPAWNDTTDHGTDGGVYILDTATDQVLDSLKISGNAFELAYDGEQTGYFIKGLMVGNIAAYSTGSAYKITSDSLFNGLYYALEADPVTGEVFALDAKDFTQNGTLRIFDEGGALLETHEVGLIPGALTFIYQEN